mmetsp:Transcript_36705/g.59512  ORF Transcript_36705/g.59512 Transcript_36705/m.59512 type:complete len:130 (-) Transcript_36705:991-1380(-)
MKQGNLEAGTNATQSSSTPKPNGDPVMCMHDSEDDSIVRCAGGDIYSAKDYSFQTQQNFTDALSGTVKSSNYTTKVVSNAGCSMISDSSVEMQSLQSLVKEQSKHFEVLLEKGKELEMQNSEGSTCDRF